jgi:unsaturated chondroitin disaccharide hydrolase
MTAALDRVSTTAALDQVAATVRAQSEHFGPAFPDDCTTAGFYRLRPAGCGRPAGSNLGWTTGFRTGLLWLACELTGESWFAGQALADVTDFAARARGLVDFDTHDLGFLYTPSCVAAWALAGDATGREAALTAAYALRRRIVQPAGIVQAWGDLADPSQAGRTIIDSLMNMPLFWWAAGETGDAAFADDARRHVAQLRDHIIRADDTTFHTFWWDTATGEPKSGTTQQGYSDNSCWARGQAWGVYGFALNAALSGDRSFLEASRRCARYWLDHQPSDRIPYWDLVFTDGSGEPRDSSAAAIAACGLLELARLTEADEAARYRSEAEATVAALTRLCAPSPGTSDGLILHGVYDMPKHHGVDEANLWGDYFYAEALMRLERPDWTPIWLAGRRP